jgi:hypothetical protein
MKTSSAPAFCLIIAMLASCHGATQAPGPANERELAQIARSYIRQTFPAQLNEIEFDPKGHVYVSDQGDKWNVEFSPPDVAGMMVTGGGTEVMIDKATLKVVPPVLKTQ